MKILRRGDRGAQVELLQLALSRAGYTLAIDGVFGGETERALRAFQRANALTPDGVAGPATHRALDRYYTGYTTHTVRSGDTFYKIAQTYSTTVSAVETANPDADPLNLRVGSSLTVPLGFEVVPDNISIGSSALGYIVRGLAARYPFLRRGSIGSSVMGKEIPYLVLGEGANRVVYNAAHHANEWITSPVLLKFAEEYARAYSRGGEIWNVPAAELYGRAEIYIVPMVNPDGVDLVVGEITGGEFYENARSIAASFPAIVFPDGWKANISGVDLNLQYPAGWEQAREIKYAQGFDRPAPRDYVGPSVLSAPESRAMYDFTRRLDPSLTVSYHSQGRVIYWKYLDIEPVGAREIAERFAEISGYAVEDVPYASGFAGYKDWFVDAYRRPGYTIEVGIGDNPLPIAQLGQIYAENLGILVYGALAA